MQAIQGLSIGQALSHGCAGASIAFGGEELHKLISVWNGCHYTIRCDEAGKRCRARDRGVSDPPAQAAMRNGATTRCDALRATETAQAAADLRLAAAGIRQDVHTEPSRQVKAVDERRSARLHRMVTQCTTIASGGERVVVTRQQQGEIKLRYAPIEARPAQGVPTTVQP
jgi:hypothetical protein